MELQIGDLLYNGGNLGIITEVEDHVYPLYRVEWLVNSSGHDTTELYTINAVRRYRQNFLAYYDEFKDR